ncbi:MAG: class I SAM-dependent methyltransferase [Acidimicrobiales bacterium]
MVTRGSDDDAVEGFWEGFYRDRPRVWSGRVNAVLAHEAADLERGTALDLGCGEGADALWLARHGWTVAAVDVSGTALERAASQADAEGLGDRITWERHDLASSFPEGTFDLVSVQYLHSPVELPREQVLRAAIGAVAPGGCLLIVGHAAGPPSSHHPGPTVRFPTPGEVLSSLELPPEGWSILRCETVDREADGSDEPQGTVLDSVVLVRRSTPS